jgi:hypothetical protein
MKFARRIGSTWYSELIGGAAQEKSLAYDLQGNPAIAYSGDEDGDGTMSTLKYAYWNGAGWNHAIVEDGVVGYGTFAELAFDPTTGWPAIVHAPWPSEFDAQVRFVKWNGGSWQAENVITGDMQFFTGLAIDLSGTPYVSYTDFDYGSGLTGLFVARFDGVDWAHELVDPDVYGTFEHHPSLAIDPTGNPSLCYFGQELGVLGLIFAHK